MIGIPAVALLWKSTEPIQSRQEKTCSAQMKKKKKKPASAASPASNWSSVLQRVPSRWQNQRLWRLIGACGSTAWCVFMWWIPANSSLGCGVETGGNNLTSSWSGRGEKKEGFSWRRHSWRHVPSIRQRWSMHVRWRACGHLDFEVLCFSFFKINNATRVHISCGKSSFEFFAGINFRLTFHQSPTAAPCCFSLHCCYYFGTFTSSVHWQRTRGCRPLSAVSCWENNKNPEAHNWWYSAELVSPCLASLFCCFFTWFERIFFVSVSIFFWVVLFQAAVQVAAVLINGKTSKVALKERHTCVCVCLSHEERSREAGLRWDVTQAAGLYC